MDCTKKICNYNQGNRDEIHVVRKRELNANTFFLERTWNYDSSESGDNLHQEGRGQVNTAFSSTSPNTC